VVGRQLIRIQIEGLNFVGIIHFADRIFIWIEITGEEAPDLPRCLFADNILDFAPLALSAIDLHISPKER
jgi:hypothetical protein